MKTELRVAAHTVLMGEAVIEVWHDGVFIGQVTGRDGPGLRVMSKYPLTAQLPRRQELPESSLRVARQFVNMLEIAIDVPGH